MFGFAWVRTHLGVILSDVLGVLKSFGLISEKKGRNVKKSRQDRGSLATAKHSHCEGTPCRSEAVLHRGDAEWEEWPGLGFVAAKLLFTA